MQKGQVCEQQRLLQKLDRQDQHVQHVVQEKLLSKQLARLREKKLCDDQERLRCRQESEELKLLERQLYMAYINKERHLQLQQKRLKKHQEQMDKERELEALHQQRQVNAFEMQEKERERIAASTRYLEGLRQQFIEKDLKKESEFKQFLKEKAIIDNIVQQIEEEDKRMVQEREERMVSMRRQMEQELACRAHQREQARLESAARDKLVSDYSEELERREATVEQARRDRLQELQRLQERLAAQQEQQQRCKEQESTLRNELEAEERHHAAEAAQREQADLAIRRVQEMQRGIELQLKQKQDAQRQEQLYNKARHKEMMEKLAEEQHLDALTAAARRSRQLDHRRQVEAMMEENRRKREEEIAQLWHEKRELERLEAARQRRVEQERLRLLEQHARQLVNFLPKGVIRDKKELEELSSWSQAGGDFREKQLEAEHKEVGR